MDLFQGRCSFVSQEPLDILGILAGPIKGGAISEGIDDPR